MHHLPPSRPDRSTPTLARPVLLGLAAALSAGGALPAFAQDAPAASAPPAAAAWQRCVAMTKDGSARLACFDQWAGQQAWQGQQPDGAGQPADAKAAANQPPRPVDTTLPATRVIEVAKTDGCRDQQYSDLSRFWELEAGSDCGVYKFRGYRPNSISVVVSNGVNERPEVGGPDDGIQYRKYENRIQLSVRTKLAENLLTKGDPTRRDSLWAGYTQQSYWQTYTPELSRPFRATDHEPEIVYVYPTTAQLPFGWRWRYTGLGLVHQSNGQSEPASRSWNRYYLMSGIELDNKFALQARVWKRINEGHNSDDNPHISDYIGRSEFTGTYNYDKKNTFIGTVRYSFGRSDRGSARLEWMRAIGNVGEGNTSNLRFHTMLFTGYGDSLIEYDKKRTLLSVGISLVDF
jgi:phospholipase A1/A2